MISSAVPPIVRAEAAVALLWRATPPGKGPRVVFLVSAALRWLVDGKRMGGWWDADGWEAG